MSRTFVFGDCSPDLGDYDDTAAPTHDQSLAAPTAGGGAGAPPKSCRPNALAPTAASRIAGVRRDRQQHLILDHRLLLLGTAARSARACRPPTRLARVSHATSHVELASPTAGQPQPSPHTTPPARLARLAALRDQAPEAYIPQQPRTPSPWRRFSPTRFTRRHRQQRVWPASVGRRINAFRWARTRFAMGKCDYVHLLGEIYACTCSAGAAETTFFIGNPTVRAH